MSYESPITIYEIAREIQKKTENDLMCIIKQHVEVDKEELIRAMNYDRNQYEAGYKDGMAAADVKCGKWEEVEIYYDTVFRCTNCKEEFVMIEGTPKENQYNYCPNCGAKME